MRWIYLRELKNKQKNKQYLVWPPFNTESVLPGGDSQTLQRLLGLVSLHEEHLILMEIRCFCCSWLTLHFVKWFKKINHYLLFLKTFLVYSNFSYMIRASIEGVNARDPDFWPALKAAQMSLDTTASISRTCVFSQRCSCACEPCR